MTSLNKKQPVGLYFYKLGNKGGGAERMTCLIANALHERNFKVHLFSWDTYEAETFYPLNPLITWHKLGWKPGLSGKWQRTRKLSSLLKENNINALIGMVMSGDKTVYAAARMAKVKLIAAERNAPSMYHHRYSKLQRWTILSMLHLVDHIVVQMPEYASKYPSTLQKKIHTIANPVQPSDLRADIDKPDKNGQYTLLAVSRLDATQKRLSILVRAFSRISTFHPDWNLKIIGDGPDKRELQALTKQLGISKRIQFTQATDKIFKEYSSANLFVMPSLWEGFPNALAEAMSHGLPAVGFAEASGVSELISKAGGWLAPGLDNEITLANTLSSAMGNSLERIRRGKKAASAMCEYNPDKQFDKWANLLNKLAA